MRTLLLAALVVAGCKDKPAQQPATSPEPTGSAAIIDWAACEAAVTQAAAAPISERVERLLAGCQVCGDWTPILAWRTPQSDGGPRRADIEAAMERCNAFCVGDARLKFFGTLDDARGKSSRTPWRQLAAVCRDKVSAVPDDRFVDGAYFALDRIARAIAARGGDLAARAAAIDLPLPAVSVSGIGAPLPAVDTPTVEASDVQVTVLAGTISIGRLPRARMSAHGLAVELGAAPYPGRPVTAPELAAQLLALAGDDTQQITLLAPAAAPAATLVPVIAAVPSSLQVQLAVRAPGSPHVELPVVIAVPLVADDPDATIAVSSKMTVQELADEVVRRAASGVERLGVTGP